MKILKISKNGVKNDFNIFTQQVAGLNVYTLEAGESGRGRKLAQIPVSKQVIDPEKTGLQVIKANQLDGPIQVCDVDKMFVIKKAAEEDNQQLVILQLNPGFRGGASYTISGDCVVLAEGYEAQGAAGRMGGAPVSVILVKGPSQIKWSRYGRLYGTEPDWVACFNGKEWFFTPAREQGLAAHLN